MIYISLMGIGVYHAAASHVNHYNASSIQRIPLYLLMVVTASPVAILLVPNDLLIWKPVTVMLYITMVSTRAGLVVIAQVMDDGGHAIKVDNDGRLTTKPKKKKNDDDDDDDEEVVAYGANCIQLYLSS
jgi:hypothetical protein